MIEIKNVTKRFNSDNKVTAAVDNVSLTINKGDIYGIVGFSGAGKSTLLRCINLLEVYDEGEITVNGKNLKQLSKKNLLKEREQIGMIFQHFNLLKSATVFENIAAPLRNSKQYSKLMINNRVEELLRLVDLEEKAQAYPSQLSGGQKQRVAIARALARDSKVILCDEATSALDPETTQSILKLLKTINRTLGVTIVLITHQMEVVKTICNKVAVMEKGKIIESGDIVDIFYNPQNSATRRMVDPFYNSEAIKEEIVELNDKLYRLSFSDEVSEKPVLSQIQKEFDVVINILFGRIDQLNNKKIGNLIIQIEGKQKEEVLNLLPNLGVKVGEIK